MGYRYPHFRRELMAEGASFAGGPAPGEPMPEFDLPTSGGGRLRKAIVVHQRALMNEEVWSCCTKPGCAFCQTAADMCPCAKNLANGGPVCPECWGGWQAGTGRLEGIDPMKVKILPLDKLKMMYGMRAKNFEKISRGADKK